MTYLLRIFFFLVSCAFSVSAYADSAEETHVLKSKKLTRLFDCEKAILGRIELSVGKDEEKIEVLAPNFLSTPLISQTTACIRFFREYQVALLEEESEMITLELQRVQGRKEDSITYRDKSGLLRRACDKLGFCERSWFDFRKTGQQQNLCNLEFSLDRYLSYVRPKFSRPKYKEIQELDVTITPFQPYSVALLDLIKDSTAGNFFYASTMNLGNKTAIDLARALRKANKGVMIALDAGVTLREVGHTIRNYFSKRANAFLVPMLPNAEVHSNFHWKIITEPDSDWSILSSMNLSNPYKNPYTDAAYHFKDREVTEELRGLLLNAMYDQCQLEEDFNCYADFLHQEMEANKWKEIYQKGCNKVHELMSRRPQQASKKYFMQPQDTDVVSLLTEFIDEAEKEVVVLTHLLSVNRVVQALERARKRGVSIFVFSTRKIDTHYKLPKEYYLDYRQAAYPDIFLPQPHMKVVIRDREKMFFGTGNLSTTALYEARELYAVTSDKVAIEKLAAVAASLYRITLPEMAHLFLPKYEPKNQLVILKKSQKLSPDIRRVLAKYTQKPKEKWMIHYQYINDLAKVHLKSCDLDSYIFIALNDFVECIKEGEGL